MALVVETGAGAATSESYASVTDGDTYFSARGYTAWTALSAGAKEQYLRRATDYMSVYRGRWAGYRTTTTQALDWPRYNVPMKDGPARAYYASDAIPAIVRNACLEFALRAAAGELVADLDAPVTSETVGPISVTYAVGARQSIKYQAVDNMLAPVLMGGGGNITLVRA